MHTYIHTYRCKVQYEAGLVASCYWTNLECSMSAMFLHLSEQCLDEGGLASSNLTHHSHQLTWLHRKIQPAHCILNKRNKYATPKQTHHKQQ